MKRPLFVDLMWICILLGMFGVAFACSHTKAVTDVTTTLSDTQKGCAISEAAAALPPFDAYLPEIEAACGIAEGAEAALLAFLNQESTQSQISTVKAARVAARYKGDWP